MRLPLKVELWDSNGYLEVLNVLSTEAAENVFLEAASALGEGEAIRVRDAVGAVVFSGDRNDLISWAIVDIISWATVSIIWSLIVAAVVGGAWSVAEFLYRPSAGYHISTWTLVIGTVVFVCFFWISFKARHSAQRYSTPTHHRSRSELPSPRISFWGPKCGPHATVTPA